ncbi:MAG TPA: nucleotidyltransferase domain-containing protein [Candidatus Brocadiales bacterium]|nr:nucleotidyltransferase domain-containing protein [Candidatus Brocadiales bacterium]
MSKLKEILQRKEKREAKLRGSLDSIVSQIKGIGALKIILFGSLVKGEVDVYSDLDLLVIMPSTKSGKEWMKLIYEHVERGIASDIIVYNKKEFDEKLPTSSFLRNVLNSGKVIYEKTL